MKEITTRLSFCKLKLGSQELNELKWGIQSLKPLEFRLVLLVLRPDGRLIKNCNLFEKGWDFLVLFAPAMPMSDLAHFLD